MIDKAFEKAVNFNEMLKTVDDLSSTKKRLEIEIPTEALESAIAGELKRLQYGTKLPGYRKGKAPFALIEKKFAKDVEGEVLERLVPEFYQNAIKEADLKPVAPPQIEGGLEFKRNEPLKMILTLEVRPEIEGLKYDSLKVHEVPVEVQDSELQVAIERLQEKKAVFEPVESPAEQGDLVVMDYTMHEDGQGYKDQEYRIGHGALPEAFSEHIVGMNKGEDKEFTCPFPEDFPSKDVAGTDVHFSVHIKEVKKASLPEIDDELAKDVGFDDLKALKDHIKGEIGTSKEATARKIQKSEVIKGLIEAHEFEAPEILVHHEYQRLLQEAAQSTGNTEGEDKMKEELMPVAERHVKAMVVVQTVGEREGVEVTDEEIKSRVEALGAQVGMPPENVMKYYVSRDGSLEGLRDEVYEDKVLELLLERAEYVKAEVKASEKGETTEGAKGDG